MCGRFAVTTDPATLAEKIEAINESRSAESAGPNYNVAPTTTITTVVRRHDEPDDEATRRVRSMRWGLVPPWAKAGADGAPESKGPLLINARAEKVTTSPAFRSSAKSKRCLIPMDGYYEWRANADTDSGKKSRKTPFSCTAPTASCCSWRGLWSVWKAAGRRHVPVVELHDHHHRCGRRARRDPRPDAVDRRRAGLGSLAGSRRSGRPRPPGRTADASTASTCGRSRHWSTVCATTAPSCSSPPSRSPNRQRCCKHR